MTYDPRFVDPTDLTALQAEITALDYSKANASTVGGIATRLNAAESDIATKAPASALASKADVSALAAKANASDVTTALAGKADLSALSTKADAATVMALSSTVSSKASQSALDAVAATVPVITTDAPLAEAVSPTAGVDGMKVPGGKHQHPRLTSTTMGTIASGSTATITFSRSFSAAPGVVITEIGGATGSTAQPAVFKVESWVMTGALYTGCVVRAWRGQTLPQNLVSLLVAAVYNLFGASVVGTNFSCIAVARSDV